MASCRKLIDIGANLTDKVFRGIYHGRQRHTDDFDHVLSRAFDVGLDKIIITAGTLSDCMEAVDLSRSNKHLFTTAGCHPTRCLEMEADTDAYLLRMEALISENRDKIVAVGECGLDYDREEFCPKDVQLRHFYSQLQLAGRVKLPLFLHCRAAHADLIDALEKARREEFNGHPIPGVVHTFDGAWSDAERLLQMGLFLGINGCSLKTEENLTVVRQIPIDRLLLETDAPWCDIRPTHAGFKYVKTHYPTRKADKWSPGHMVKGRNEPANIIQVLEILSAVKQIDPDSLADQVYRNTTQLFHFHDM